ncbi:(2Fe-2S)-binding protein [Eubacteriales bacterium OttesenSCG-928-M02]|nr:(2Fe-2S)-binding protein [Eubacteriales bacterium OttesenSCG-928-M02]
MNDNNIVCYCSNVTKVQIEQAISEGAKTLDDIRKMTGACTIGKCKELSPRKVCCSPEIVKILNQYKNQ